MASKLLKWSVTFGIISLITLFIFIYALHSLIGGWVGDNAMIIAIIAGILLVIFVATGTLSVRAMWVRMKNKLS